MRQLEVEKSKRSHCNAHDSEILDPQSDFKQIKVHAQMQIHFMQTNTNTYLETNKDILLFRTKTISTSATYDSKISVLQTYI